MCLLSSALICLIAFPHRLCDLLAPFISSTPLGHSNLPAKVTLIATVLGCETCGHIEILLLPLLRVKLTVRILRVVDVNEVEDDSESKYQLGLLFCVEICAVLEYFELLFCSAKYPLYYISQLSMTKVKELLVVARPVIN